MAAEAMLRVLRHPSRYRWVKLEAREAGRLDDVFVYRIDGTVEATQVKFSTDALRPGDPWTWDKLLEETNGRPSLIRAWYESVVGLDPTHQATEPRLVSNRLGGDDLLLTEDGYVDRNRTAPVVLERLRAQLGDGSDDFLRRFRFEVGEQDLRDLNDRLAREFRALGLLEQNWVALKDAIRGWIRGEGLPETGEISTEHIRSASGWRQLSPLPQGLEIPRDYTLPLQGFHDDFLSSVTQGAGSAIVLTAGPGMGKSTYLSYLVEKLHEQEQPVVRHHYSLRASGDRPERLEARRAAESLVADIETCLSPYVHELPTQNPDPGALRAWLDGVGAQLADEGKFLVVVVDGLDHVWRARNSREELQKLFDQLLPAPPGIVVVVGTQPVEDQQLPPSLLRFAPREQWIELPRLDRQAIREWLTHHRDLMPAEWAPRGMGWHHAELARVLHARTRGHPLLMRYTVEQVASRGESLTTNSIRVIPEAPAGTVEDYYRALWVSLPDAARDVVFLLAVARFPWPEGGLHECLRLVGYEQASASMAVSATRHLLADDGLGWSPFHSSLLLYAGQQAAFVEREPALRQAAIEWLEGAASEYWRRSHLWLLQLDAGDADHLMAGSAREWVVEAVAASHPLGEIEDVLRAAAFEAIEQADLTTYVDRGILADTVDRSASDEDALRWMFAAQLSLGADDFLEPRAIARLSELSDRHVIALARHLHLSGRPEAVERCFDELKRRLAREAADLRWFGEQRERRETVAELAGLAGIEPERFARFAASLGSEDMQASLATNWVAGLRRAREVRFALRALAEPLSAAAARRLSCHVAMVGADEGIALSEPDCQLLASPYAWVYRMFHEGDPGGVATEEPPAPAAGRDYAFEQYPGVVARYAHDLFFFIVVREFQSPGFAGRWAPPATLRSWLTSSLEALAQGAVAVAEAWKHSQEVDVVAGYEATRPLKTPPWDDGMEDRESSTGIRRALRTITEDLLVLRRAAGGSAELHWEEVASVASHTFADHGQILRWVAEGTADIDIGALRGLSKSVDDELAGRIAPFDSRANTFALLAAACARYGLRQDAEQHLRQAAENLVAYGSHKDILLHSALNAIEAGADRFDGRRQLWIGLAPAIAAVLEFTDGDETSHLAARFGALLLRFDADLAIRYMKALMDSERYQDVDGVLRDLVRSADLANPELRDLVSTCIDPDSIRFLEDRARNSDQSASELLELSPRYSSSLAEVDAGSVTSTTGDDIARVASDSGRAHRHVDFPPERLADLVRSEALAWPLDRERELSAWLDSWADTERAADALDAAELYFFGDDRLSVSNQTVAAARRIGGRSGSYRWLVRAQQTNNGWREYWTSFEDAKERWRWVKRDFPSRWRDFLTESLRPLPGVQPHFGMTIARIVEYLIYFERWQDAAAVTSQLVATLRDQVSGQALPMPDWAEHSAEST
ncbi:MAG: ATP-binding protein [Chloroflexi bacterium]|nr:ATP-binding protein [Chloroflexota bacterium]